MTLTHDEIAAMTPNQVDRAIAEREGRDDAPDYHESWRESSRMMQIFDDFALSKQGNVSECAVFTQRGDIDHTAPTAPEAIARCFLEWWEVTHEEAE